MLGTTENWDEWRGEQTEDDPKGSKEEEEGEEWEEPHADDPDFNVSKI